MTDNFRLVIKEDENCKLVRIGAKSFADEIIYKSTENILKSYVYVDSYRVIA